MKARLLIFFLYGLALLPLGGARRLGSLMGNFAWIAGTRMARTTRSNLVHCYPGLTDADRESLGRASLKQTFRTVAESGAVWLWPPDKILGRVMSVEGLPLLREAVAMGRGVVVIAPHLGNWELFGLYLNRCGCGPSSQLYQAPSSPMLDRFIRRARGRAGANMVATDRHGVKALLQCLRRGEIIGILPDQVPPASGGEFAPFFGRPALTMTLVSRLLQHTGARALVGYAMRETTGFKVVFQAADDNIYAQHMQASLAGLNTSIEAAVKSCPDQYQWEYKRFKRVPAGEAPLYRD